MLHRLATPQLYRQVGLIVIGAGINNATAPSSALCEKSIIDTILRKNRDGSVDVAGSFTQVSDADFWDRLGKATGSKVSSSWRQEAAVSSVSDNILQAVFFQLQTVVDSGVPTQVSYGFISGYCSGFALKTAGRVAAIILGMCDEEQLNIAFPILTF